MTTPIPLRNLPSELTPIVGREEELEQLSRILTNPDARLVTVTGIGGMGKTRLVVATARKLWRERPDLFMDGIVYVSLAALDSVDAIPTALAQELDSPMSGQDQPMAEVCNYLGDKSTLLILDNFEQLVEGANILYELLEASDAIRLLVTSRVPLQLQAEWRFDLAGLSYPRQTGFDQEVSSDSYEAVQLFVQNARQVSPDFQLTEESTAHVLDLCRLVAGMPLAIKLAAGWLRAMPLEKIVAELSRSMELLASNARDLPARQHSVQAIFEYSWELLQPEEQRIAKALSVFRGGFTEDAAAEVAFVAPEMLAALIDRGLVQPAGVAGYEMHELSRQFAARKLGADYLEAPVAHRRHAVFYLDFVARQEPVLLGRAPTVAVAALQSEIDNIRQAWRWAVKEKDYRALEQALEVLAIFYEITGLLAEAEQLFGDAAEQLDDWSQTDESSSLVCQLLVKKARFSIDRSDLNEARKAIDQASSLANALQNRWRLAEVHFIRGYAYRYSGEYEKGIKELHEAAQIFRSLDMEYQLVNTLNILGESQARYQLHEESLDSHHQALDLATGLNDARGEALTLSHIGHAYFYQEEYQQSLSYFERALKLFERQNDLLARSRTTANIGFLHNRLGNEEQALNYTNQAIKLFKQIGSGPEFTFDVLGDIAFARGDYELARNYYESALAFVQDSGQRLEESQLLAMLGRLDMAMGRYDAAGRQLQLALAIATDLDNIKVMPMVRGDIGLLLWRRGQTDEALLHFDQAITGLRRVSGRFHLAYFLVEKGALLYELGALEEAQAVAVEGLEMAKTMGRKPTIFRARILLAMIDHAQDRPADAHEALEGLLSETNSPAGQAAVHFALWKTQSAPENGRAALELYRQLAATTPDILYQDRLAELEAALPGGVG